MDDGKGVTKSKSKSVDVFIIDPQDSRSDTPLENQQIDVNIAIQEGIRWLYLQHQKTAAGDTYWAGSDRWYGDACGATGFALWAIQNQGHRPSNDPDTDIFASLCESGIHYLVRNARVHTLLKAARADKARGAVADGISDLNKNLRAIELCPYGFGYSRSGYREAIACSALAATASPDHRIKLKGHVLDGVSYKEIVEDCVDWIGLTQNLGSDSGLSLWRGRGGWAYVPSNADTASDMSINSWVYVALDGAEEVFGIPVPDWIKQECEYALAIQQRKGQTRFWYRNSRGGHATTGGGLSGLVLVESEGRNRTSTSGVQVGQILLRAESTMRGDQAIKAKRDRALSYVGGNWSVSGVNGGTGAGNHGNPYCMWTLARALRLTARSTGLPDSENLRVTKGTITFDWATGELGRTGKLAAAGTTRAPGAYEGYFTYLLREQQRTAAKVEDRGTWSNTAYGTRMTTALCVLVLTPRVFSECPPSVQVKFLGMQPAANTQFPAGAQVVLMGQALASEEGRPIVGVTVDGQPVSSLDSVGNFFQSVTVQEGRNTYDIVATERCGDARSEHVLIGKKATGGVFENLSDFTSVVEVRYRNTSYDRRNKALLIDAIAYNRGTVVLDGPVYMVMDRFADPSMLVREPRRVHTGWASVCAGSGGGPSAEARSRDRAAADCILQPDEDPGFVQRHLAGAGQLGRRTSRVGRHRRRRWASC